MAGTTKKTKKSKRLKKSKKTLNRREAMKQRMAAVKAVNLVERAVTHERFLVAAFYVDSKNILHQEHQPGDFLYGDMPTAIRLLRESLSEKIRLREDRERRELGMEIPEDDEEDVDERLAEPSE